MGDLADAEPCAQCLKMLYFYGFRKMYYTTNTSGVLTKKVKYSNTTHLASQFKKFLRNDL